MTVTPFDKFLYRDGGWYLYNAIILFGTALYWLNLLTVNNYPFLGHFISWMNIILWAVNVFIRRPQVLSSLSQERHRTAVDEWLK